MKIEPERPGKRVKMFIFSVFVLHSCPHTARIPPEIPREGGRHDTAGDRPVSIRKARAGESARGHEITLQQAGRHRENSHLQDWTLRACRRSART